MPIVSVETFGAVPTETATATIIGYGESFSAFPTDVAIQELIVTGERYSAALTEANRVRLIAVAESYAVAPSEIERVRLVVATESYLISESGALPTNYFMRAWDDDGAQFVYWETEDPTAAPAETVPVAVGVLSQVRIFQQQVVS